MTIIKKPHLVYLGLSGFPRGLAPIQRQKLISKSLIDKNWNVSIICNRGVHGKHSGIESSGFVEGIYYEYFHDSTRIDGAFRRNLYKLIAPFGEFMILQRMKRQKGITAAIISDRNLIWDALKYRIYSLILGFKIYINLVELFRERPEITLLMKLNDFIFNKIGIYFYDGVIPISRYLVDKITKYRRRTLHVPIIVDTDVFIEVKCEKQNHILYCGSASYINAIMVVLRSFALLTNKEVNLVLVIGGSNAQIEKVRKEIQQLGIQNRVMIKSNISDFELSTLYVSSKALLLPLFDTIQDNARFPHKFGEYLASGSTIITNPIGEITSYLTHLENVIYTMSNEPSEMAFWIDWVLENEIESINIGRNGRDIAVKFFDYRVYSEKIAGFLAN